MFGTKPSKVELGEPTRLDLDNMTKSREELKRIQAKVEHLE